MDEQVPEVWELEIGDEGAHAVVAAQRSGSDVTLGSLLRDPGDRDERLPVIPLLLARNDQRELLPNDDLALRIGDRLLFCGRAGAYSRMRWTLQNEHALSYIVSGANIPQGAVWRGISALLGGLRRAGQRQRPGA